MPRRVPEDRGPMIGLETLVPGWLRELGRELPTPRQRACFKAFCDKRRMMMADFDAAYASVGVDLCTGSLFQTVMHLRDHLLGTGWHIATLGGYAFELRPGEDEARLDQKLSVKQALERVRAFDEARRAEEAEAARARRMVRATPPEPVTPPKPAPVKVAAVKTPELPSVIGPARKPAIPLSPKGACQYVVTAAGKVAPCGAPASGTYCPRHRAAVAGVPYREGMF